MFQKFDKTAFPPSQKPMLVWDGECGFCKYWITHWKTLTKDKVEYRTFQEVASKFEDIPLKEFKKASRLIELDGSVYSGPDSAYRSYDYADKPYPWHRWYVHHFWFTKFSDHTYNLIAKHRPTMFTLTKICFGKNPSRLRPYWLIYILLFLIIILLLLKLI